MLSAAELERMLVEDRQQRDQRDDERLVALGIVERKYNPLQPRDPGGEDGGQWTKSPTSAAKAVVDFAERLAKAATKQDALDATPAKLTRAPGGHHGNYEGEALTGPPGMGSVRALSEYEGVEYANINTALRVGDFSDQAEVSRIAEIDKTMAVSRLTEDARVDRVIQHGSAVFGREAWYGGIIDFNETDLDVMDAQEDRWYAGERPNLTGLRWVEKGYSSTTADPAVAKDFGKRWPEANSAFEGEPVIMTILVPEGTGGVQLAEMGHAAEILLQRDLTFEVAADHGVDEDGFRRLDVVVLPDGK